MLLTHCENSETTWSQSIQHVVKALSGEEIGAEAGSACDYIKGSPISLRESLLAHNERLYFFIDALALQARLFGLATALCVEFCQALLRQKLSNLPIVCTEIEDFRIIKAITGSVFRENFDYRLNAHFWLIEGDSFSDIVKAFSNASAEVIEVDGAVRSHHWELLAGQALHARWSHR